MLSLGLIYMLLGTLHAFGDFHGHDANSVKDDDYPEDHAHVFTFQKNNPDQKVDATNKDWCKVEPAGMHTMCLFEGPDEECAKRTVWRVLDDVGKKSVVDMHNVLRDIHAGGREKPHPASSNMMKLVWSDELEEVAQRWADQCHTKEHYHDDNRNKLDGSYVGQNVEILGKFTEVELDYDSYYGDYDYDRVTNYIEEKEEYRQILMDEMGNQTVGWYEEHTRFDAKNHADDSIEHLVFHHNTGHYTQMAWAKTREVGCGWVLLKEKEQPKEDYIDYGSLLVCNYSPAGNYPGQQIYKVGPPASECPEGYSADETYPSLCSPE